MKSDEKIEAKGQGCDLAFRCGDARVLVVDTAGAGIATRLLAWVKSEHWYATADAGSWDVRYVIDTWHPMWGDRTAGYRISRDGQVRYLGRSTDALGQWLRRDIEEQATRRSRHGSVIQAAAVVWRDQAIVIPGGLGSGITNLVVELVRHGAIRYADDLVVLDDRARAHPTGRDLDLPASPVALVVSTTYQPELSWQPHTLRGARAVLPLIGSALAQRDHPRHLLSIAARLARTVVTLQGPHTEASRTAPLILAALDGLLDHPSPIAAPTPRLVSRAREVVGAQRIADGAP